jgi:hypothetical protein
MAEPGTPNWTEIGKSAHIAARLAPEVVYRDPRFADIPHNYCSIVRNGCGNAVSP